MSFAIPFNNNKNNNTNNNNNNNSRNTNNNNNNNNSKTLITTTTMTTTTASTITLIATTTTTTTTYVTELQSPDRVSDGVQGRGPEGQTHHFGDHQQNTPRYTRLSGQSYLYSVN